MISTRIVSLTLFFCVFAISDSMAEIFSTVVILLVGSPERGFRCECVSGCRSWTGYWSAWILNVESAYIDSLRNGRKFVNAMVCTAVFNCGMCKWSDEKSKVCALHSFVDC